MFINLTRSYLEALNMGAVPNIESAWDYLCKEENEKSIEQSIEFFDK